jgi:hypothetical protein
VDRVHSGWCARVHSGPAEMRTRGTTTLCRRAVHVCSVSPMLIGGGRGGRRGRTIADQGLTRARRRRRGGTTAVAQAQRESSGECERAGE